VRRWVVRIERAEGLTIRIVPRPGPARRTALVLAAGPDRLRLNIGAGDDRHDGYVHVDLRRDVADVVASADQLPYRDDGVAEILALDMLEHFPAARTHAVLREWHRVLIHGGRLTIKVPNLAALAQAIVDDRTPALMIRNIYGGHRWGPDGMWDAHHTGWTPRLLREQLRDAGFTVVSVDEDLNMTFEAEAV
jgi:predicted SAM-dependent methyltransferase